MFLKKTILLGTLMLPLVAHAALVTNNYTNEPSTVRVTSGFLQPCSAVDPTSGITKPNEKNHTVPTDLVNALCMTSPGGICEADIYMTSNCSASGPAVAHATLNLTTGEVKIVNFPGTRYEHDSAGPVVNLRYKKQ